LGIKDCMRVLQVCTYLYDSFVNLFYRISIHKDLRKGQFSIVSLHVLQGSLHITAQLTILSKVSQVVKFEFMENLFDLLGLPAMSQVDSLMELLEESVKLCMNLGLIFVNSAVFHISELLLKHLKVFLELLHNIHNQRPEVEYIMILVVAVNSTDLTNKELVTTPTHLR
jgi:hypothetical protein